MNIVQALQMAAQAQNAGNAQGVIEPQTAAYLRQIWGMPGGPLEIAAPPKPAFNFPVGQQGGGYRAPTYNWQAWQGPAQAQAAPVQSFSNMLYGGQAPRPQWQQPNFAAMFQPQKGVMK